MTPTYQRKPAKQFLANGDDDSGWDEEDEELARGYPLEPDIAAISPNGQPGWLNSVSQPQWWKNSGNVDRSPDNPLLNEPSGASVEGLPEVTAAKGVAPTGPPIDDAIAAGDTTPVSNDAEVLRPKVTTGEEPLSNWQRWKAGVEGMPTLKPAPWYQNLASRVAGGLAGWSNAASRTRNPIDIGALKEGVLHPGYGEKMQVWESQMAPIKAGLAAEMGQREAALKQLDIQQQANLRAAQAEQARGRGAWYQAQAGQKWQVDHQAGVIYNKDSGEMMPLPNANDPVDLYNKVLRLTGDKEAALTAAFPHARPTPPEKQAIPIGAGGLYLPGTDQIIARPTDPFRAEAAQDRQARTDLERQRIGNEVDEKKRLGEAEVQNWLNSQIRQRTQQAMQQARDANRPFNPNSVSTDDLRQQAARKLQAIQDTYAAAVRRSGGTAPDFDIDPNTLEARPRANKTQGAAPAPQSPANTQQQTKQQTSTKSSEPEANDPPVHVLLPNGKYLSGPRSKVQKYLKSKGFSLTDK